MTTQNGMNGFLVVGPSGKSIFLPAVGYRRDTDLVDRGSYGDYWSATLNEFESYGAFGLGFDSSGSYWDYRYFGRTVRPVTE